MIAKYPYSRRRGAVQFSAAQWLIFGLALLCLGIIINVYQSNAHLARAQPTALPDSSRTHIALLQNLAQWQTSLQQRNVALTCPYLGNDYVARIDLPDRRAITLDPWDYTGEAKVASDGYVSFVKARQKARVDNPTGCMVHVYDSTGEEVARANQFGVVTSQYAPIPGT